MRESFNLPVGFPSTEQLSQETYKALIDNGGVATTKEIKAYIINKLNLSEEVIEFENSDGLTTLIDYRLRWARTSLKNEGKIKNVKRGTWAVA